MTTEMQQSEQVVSEKKKRRKIVSLDRKKARAGWLFILPFVIGFVIIYDYFLSPCHCQVLSWTAYLEN